MAEFKLGRIRFIWKGDWTPSTVYYKDDVIRYGGNNYVCIAGNTSTSDFYNDLSSFWNKISDGQEWKADWTTSAYYKVNDVVKYGGSLYIANTGHTSSATESINITGITFDSIEGTVTFAHDATNKVLFAAGSTVQISNAIPSDYNGSYTVESADETSVTVTSGLELSYVSGGEILTGLEVDITKWDLYGEGFDYKGDWTISTRYKENDIVKYNAVIYIATQEHVSSSLLEDGLELDIDKWDVFSTGFFWRSNWATETRYRKYDIVRYGGSIYVCNTGHTSVDNFTDGLEADIVNWDIFNQGFAYRNDWESDVRYRFNDVVKYGGGLWICTNPHTSQTALSLNESDWAQFVEGLEFEDSWSAGTVYQPGDIVSYGGFTYTALTINNSKIPTEYPADWSLFTAGFRFLGDWGDDSTNQDYRTGDVVRVNGYTYLCIEDTQTEVNFKVTVVAEPEGNRYYLNGEKTPDLTFAVGSTFVLTQNDESNDTHPLLFSATQHGTHGGGIEYTNNVSYFLDGIEAVDSTAYIAGFAAAGNRRIEITIDSSTPDPLYYYCFYHDQMAGDAQIDIVPDSVIKPPSANWERLNSGFEWRNAWTDGTYYNLGDVIRYGESSYICVTEHVSDETVEENRPDQDDGTYWNLMAGGPELSVMNTEGDLVYFGPTGPTRLPIGSAGQTLTVNSAEDAPEWRYLGRINHVWYVSPDGTDSPAPLYGTTLDQPWKTVRYACEQVENGALNPNASYLLERNRHFIQAEVTEWVDFQVTNVISPFPNDFTYNKNEWKTSIGLLTDALQSDLRKGGNSSTLLRTLSYFTAFYVYGTSVADQSFGYYYPLYTTAGEAESYDDLGLSVSFTFEEYPGQTFYMPAGNQNVAKNIPPNDIVYGVGSQSYPSYDQLLYAGWSSANEQNTQVLAALGYMKTLIDRVVSNLAPDVNYQTQNGVGDPILQFIDATYSEEETAQIIIDSNLDIIIDAITAETATGVPGEIIPNNSIFVKTGIFEEVLPIVVPEKTAIIGDELRSTKISPAGQLTPSGDTVYSLAGIQRLIDIASNIVLDPSAITKTAGNPEDPDTTRPAGSSDAASEAQNLFQQIYDYIDWAVNGATGDSTEPQITGSNIPQTSTDYTYAVDSIEANRDFLVEEVIAYIADQYPAYSYNEDKCRRDVNRYIDAVKHDLIYTGNYKSFRSAKLYAHSVAGSTLSDMFYLRNATGLRNCTLIGLEGTLSAPNEFGTRRPTAGAYCSLDPGWGPDHEEVWVKNKSPYVQNVSTFGTACIGLKVDGDLHAKGNDSIVANDFTQILSDGIGYWVTNLGRSELVSVFTYYNHIGYLAENGGKIRATNGNNSYGTFGSVAEGVDSTEVPITGKINNRTFEAIVDNVYTDGDEILVFEYLNAGQNYTPAETTTEIIGEGFNVDVDSLTTVDGGVFEVRMLDLNDSSGDFGGDGYITSENVAQGGNTTSITISNTDTSLSSQYIGMAIWITAGTGAGQYAYIDTYNAGTKVATVKKPSDDSAGWDHLVPGTAIVTELDGTTNYLIVPRVIFEAPPSGLYADTAKGRAFVDDNKVIKITIYDPGQGYVTAPTVTLTDPNRTADAPTEARIADGVLSQPVFNDRGQAYTTASADITGDGFADRYQPGEFLRVDGLTSEPQPGSNVEIASIPGVFFKLVAIRQFLDAGDGTFTAQLQVSPEISIADAPEHSTDFELRIRYSQVRLTGHDFLDIGTGNFENTNYPNIPLNDPDADNETRERNGGRVFYTSTDQDGNFRVGELFSVEQSTGIATLNADAFNISGLQELSLGELDLGGTGVTINEFSADGTFSANSDTIVPTQKAIRTYITSQIGGGAATLNVNSVTAGEIQITTNEITTTTDNQIEFKQKVDFEQGVSGFPIAMNYYLQS